MDRPTILDANESAINSLSLENAVGNIRDLCSYIRHLEDAASSNEKTTASEKVAPSEEKATTGPGHSSNGVGGASSVTEERLRQQQQEASRRENVLVMRLTAKEQEVQEYLNKLEEIRMNAASTSRTVLLDPVVNIIFQNMKSELQQSRDQVEQTRQEMNAWKFTPDSNTGKRLMARCRTLIQENEELGKLCNSGRVAKLEGDLSLTRNDLEGLRRTQAEVDDFLLELDEDMEGLQSTILYLQGQLKKLHEENRRLRSMAGLGMEDGVENGLTKGPIGAVAKEEECPVKRKRRRSQ